LAGIGQFYDRQAATSRARIWDLRPPLQSWRRALSIRHKINVISMQHCSLHSLAIFENNVSSPFKSEFKTTLIRDIAKQSKFWTIHQPTPTQLRSLA
jgi:hypothetical protein